MSIVVSFTPLSPDQTLAARQRRMLRQRCLLIAGTLVLTGGMAAIPLPVWKASAAIGTRAQELRGWIDDAQAEQREAQAFLASGGQSRGQRLDDQVSRWLAPHDRIETTKRLLFMARSAGLAVTRADVQPDMELLLVDASRQGDTAVLGTNVVVAANTTPRVTGTPLPLSADRFVLEGRGPATSLLLFCGVLAAMPAPMRLRSLHLKADDAHLRFTVTIEKLRDGPLIAPALPAVEPPTEELHDA